MAFKPFTGNDSAKGGGFQSGKSGNPGGRPSIKIAVEKATGGKSTSEVTAEIFKMLYDAAHKLDPGDKDESASWRHATSTLLAYLVGKPREHVHMTGSVAQTVDVSRLTDDQLEAIASIALDDAPTEH